MPDRTGLRRSIPVLLLALGNWSCCGYCVPFYCVFLDDLAERAQCEAACADLCGPDSLPAGGGAHGEGGADQCLVPQSAQFRVDEEANATEDSSEITRFDDGEFVVVWQRNEFLLDQTYVQRYDANGAKIGGSFQLMPGGRVLARGDKSLVVAGASGSDIVAQRFAPDGDPEGPQFAVNTYTTGYQTVQDLAELAAGGFVVVWESKYFDGLNYDRAIRAQRFDADGDKLGGEFIVNQQEPHDTYGSSRARVDSASDGRFVVVWNSEVGQPLNPADLVARVYDEEGDPATGEFTVNTFTEYIESDADVAMRDDGSFVVAWTSPYGDDAPGGGLGDSSVTFRRYDASASPLGDEFHLNSYATGDQRRPDIALDDDGSFVVAWESTSSYLFEDNREGDGSAIFGRCFSAGGGPIGEDFLLNTYTTGDQTQASIDTDGAGNFVVTWTGAYTKDLGYGLVADLGVAARRFGLSGISSEVFEVEKYHEDTWDPGAVVTFTIEVRSFGEASEDVILAEIVPPRTSFVPASSSPGWDCVPDNTAGSSCTLELGDLEVDEIRTAEFAVRVDGNTPLDWVLYNDAVATRLVPDTMTREEACDSPAEDFVLSSIAEALCNIAPEACLGFFCHVRPNDTVCPPGADLAPAASPRAAGCVRPVSSLGLTLLKVRDRELMETRGGRRLVDLAAAHDADLTEAAEEDPDILTYASAGLGAVTAELAAIAEGEDSGSVIDTATVMALQIFFDKLRAAAPQALADVMDRELPRIDMDSWVGLTPRQALAFLARLTCEGFEEVLFCGEVTGDCVISASDALMILRIAVGTLGSLPEADVNGSGSVLAGDAQIALQIAVGSRPPTDECNLL